MQTVSQKAKRILFLIYLLALHAVVIYLVGERVLHHFTSLVPFNESAVSGPEEDAAIPTPLPVPESFADATDANFNTNANLSPQSGSANVTSSEFIIPVAGVRPDQLIDTFSASRSEGRYHDAIDIPAAAGTPVVAAADGEIVKFFDSERGGITIYQLTADRRFALYYGHLQRRAAEISVGMHVRQGMTIGFVGDTGNAGAGNFHLHFSIAIINDPKHFTSGTYINPYTVLRSGHYVQ